MHTFCSVGKTTYAVGTDGEIKEIGLNTIRRNLGLIGCGLDTIALSRSDLMLFITGGEGGVTTVQLPLLDKANFNEFHMHNQKITCIALAYDDQTVVSVAEDASICLWRLTNADGRAIALDKDFAYSKEILISKKDLQEKINSINVSIKLGYFNFIRYALFLLRHSLFFVLVTQYSDE